MTSLSEAGVSGLSAIAGGSRPLPYWGGENTSHSWPSWTVSQPWGGDTNTRMRDFSLLTVNTTLANMSATVTSQLDPRSFADYQTAVVMWKCVSPVLLLLGGFGNIATILVLSWQLERTSSTQPLFLLTVAVSDLCLLYSGLFLEMCFYLFGVDLQNLHSIPCTGFLWLSLASNSTSAWLLVTVTLQRTVCVALPYKMTSLFSRRRSKIVIGTVITTAAGLHSHVFYGLHVPNVHPGHCTAVEDYHHFWETVWSWIDLCVSSLLPSLILFVCNLFLVLALRRQVRNAATLTAEPNAGHLEAQRKAASSTTLTVLLLSFTFLCLTVPHYAFLIWSHPVTEHSAPDLQARVKLVWTLTSLMWYANSAVNFLLYCISGSKFRADFLRRLPCSNVHNTPTIHHLPWSSRQTVTNGHPCPRQSRIMSVDTTRCNPPPVITTRL